MALLDVVKWDNAPGEVIFRFREGEIAIGSQLIVKEGQQAIFFKEGQALDAFGAGRHTLKTGNIPILEKLINLPFGGSSPFPAEVYFINTTEIPNLKWGTKQPFKIMDPEFRLAVPMRAFGSYAIRITDLKQFVIQASGTWQAFDTDSIGSAMRDQIIVPKIQDLISEYLKQEKTTALDATTYLDEISAAAKGKMGEDFASYGIELVRFAIESINVPDEDPNVQRLQKALADKAEMNIMGEDYKTKRTFDTMEKAAENEGMAGGMVGAGMGMGMGQQMGQMMGGMTQNVAGGQQQAQGMTCPHCNAANPAGGKFCSSCGKEMVVQQAACPACNEAIPANSKFCPKCGANLEGSSCKKCNARLAPGAKFCPECGEAQ